MEVDVNVPRGLALTVHQKLRQFILDGTVAAGTTLNQAELARAFGVSRTPMREAFRMLQEEGLINAEPDRRAVVVGLDLGDLDAMYGARLLIEGLAVSLTVPSITPAAVEALEDALRQMRDLREQRQTAPAWNRAHDEFHRLATDGADAQVLRLLAMFRERTHPYLRLAQSSADETWREAERRHQAILDAFQRRDTAAAVAAMVDHLAATAFRVVASADPGRDLPTVRNAVAMVRGGAPALGTRGLPGGRGRPCRLPVASGALPGSARLTALVSRPLLERQFPGLFLDKDGDSVECSFVAVRRIRVTWESSQVRTAFGRQSLPRSDST
jgi:DNA-binding GntR family transcriptional regulator